MEDRADIIDAMTAKHLIAAASPPSVLDTQWVLGGSSDAGYEQYLAAHLPGAQHCDLETVLARPRTPGSAAIGGRHPLPNPADLQRDLRKLGVTLDRPVVVYDDGAGYAAARAWWVLTWAGHPDVRVLDGGLVAWQEAGGEIERGVPQNSPVASSFTVVSGSLASLDAEGVAELLEAGGLVLDARAPERFRGDIEPIDPVAGHIPGARNLPTTAIMRASGGYRTAEQIRATLGALDAEREIAVYCGSGVTASHVLLGLRTAGIRATLYPGSWSDWITDPQRGVERGSVLP
ncbi:MAG: sulfurtransferase [Antricoccus sp.]